MDIDKKEKNEILRAKFEKLRQEIDTALELLDGDIDLPDNQTQQLEQIAKRIGRSSETQDGQIIEGIFDGVQMVGPDGERYSVPENYASKSKLVEGDVLKLTIGNDGRFVYKQISPKPRTRLRGTLIKDDETSDFYVMAEGRLYQVILASVTYFKGEVGDDVIIVVPQSKKSHWAAIENIIKMPHGKTSDEVVNQAMRNNNIEILDDPRISDDDLLNI